MDYGFGAQAADFEQVLEGGLVVSVAEVVVVGGGGVPSLGEGEGSFCTFLSVLPFRRQQYVKGLTKLVILSEANESKADG